MQNLPRLMFVVAMLALGTSWTVVSYVGGLHAAPDMSLCEQPGAAPQAGVEAPAVMELIGGKLTVGFDSGSDASFAAAVVVSSDSAHSLESPISDR